jgi:hypothetical protein
MLSGGMDSAVMLFLILKEITDKQINANLTVFNVPNINDNAFVHSKNVVDYLKKYFNITINLKNIGDGSAHHRKLINEPARALIENKIVDVLYSGQNQFPPESINWESYKALTADRFVRRDPDAPESMFVKYPFIKLYKHHILELYNQFDILDLAYITHSCTREKEIHCKQCLWCTERTWAFDQLKLEDKAT